MSGWDWAFLIWSLVITTGVGLWYSKRAGKNLSEYFVSGRNLPWWALGTSIIATSFAADTPIVIAGWVVSSGVAQNWLWWNFLFGGTLTVFLFARWWRRSEVLTEIQLIELRYDGRAARVLRGCKALFLGLVVNVIVFGWVTKAMGSVVEQVFDVPRWWSLGVLLAISLGYTVLSGLWGVVATDVLQFAIAMLGAILLAVLGVAEVGGLGTLIERVQELELLHDREILSIFPSAWDGFTLAILLLVLVNWWAVYYPGNEPGGGGYAAQRMFAAIDERHARAGVLWYILAHFVLRPWPWILVALAAMVLEPGFLGPESGLAAEEAYPWMFRLLPTGLLGLVVASFLAAFMSTITTTLNLSASYLINDLYLPFVRPEASDREQVDVSRIAVVLVSIAGCVVTLRMESAGEGWETLMGLTAGSGLVLILRWVWWRVNAWSEITAIAASALAYLGFDGWLRPLFPGFTDFDPQLQNSLRLVTVVAFATVAWLSVTFLTRPVDSAQLERFYRRVRPGGAWGPVARACGLAPSALGPDLKLWGLSTVMVFAALFGIGSALLGSLAIGLGCLLLSLIAAVGLARGMRAQVVDQSSAPRR